MRSDASPAPATKDALVLAAARIAEDLITRCSPSEEAMFTFAANVVSAAGTSDRRAAPLAFELAAGLLDNVPAGRVWSGTRGWLQATKVFAWLLLQSRPEAAFAMETEGATDAPAAREVHVSAQISGDIRETLTLCNPLRIQKDAD